MKATEPGTNTTASNEDIFTMLKVFGKTNAVSLTLLKGAEYHEKMTRTLTSKLNDFEAIMKELEDKGTTQSSGDDVVNKLAELLKQKNCPKVQSGGHKPVSEHKAVQQLKSFTGDRSKFREWNEKLLNALAQVDVRNRKVLKTQTKSWGLWTEPCKIPTTRICAGF